MSRKAWIITGVTLGILAVVSLSGGGYMYWKASHAKPKSIVAVQGASSGGSEISLNDSIPNAIPLGGGGSNDSSSSLRVTTNNGLGGGLGGDTSGGSSGGSSSSSSSSKIPDPSGFKVYDQYKSSKDALYVDITPGNGATLDMNKKAAVYYKGWLTTGELIDQTKATEAGGEMQPFVFTLGEHKVIVGWEEGLYGMKVGGKRRIIIPPSVGYGDKGAGAIPPGAVLVFDVELLAVQ